MRTGLKKLGKLGFSLIELLTVVAILGILAFAGSVAFSNIGRSNAIMRSAHQIADDLNAARQHAVTYNRAVEVRFIKTSGSGTGETAYSGLAFFEVGEDDARLSPLGRFKRMPTPAILAGEEEYSSLLHVNNTTEPLEALGALGTQYEYAAFRFRPDGSLNLNSARKWFVTVKNSGDTPADGGLPANFATIQIDGPTGRIRMLRP